MKRILATLLLAASLLLPAVAAEAASGVYVAPKFVMSDYNLGTVSRSNNLHGFGVGSEDYWTFGGSIAVGYDFFYEHMIPLRAEFEFAVRSNASENWSGSRGKVESEWNTKTSFLNLYWDFHNSSDFVPYVGAGIGMAHQYASYDIKSGGYKESMDESYTTFAWNAGIGVAYNINPNLAIDLGYRFVGLGNHELSQNTRAGEYSVKTSPYSNEFSVGARFNF